jgi:acetyl esterase/lipase
MQTPPPTCTPYNTASPTPSITVLPTCSPSPVTCSGCDASPGPSCPEHWPTDSPTMTPISSPQPGDGTILEWRVYPPCWKCAYPPSSPTPGPGVLVIHGGNWNFGSPFLVATEKVCEELSTAGFWVFSGDYRLAPCNRIRGQPGHGTEADTPSGRPPEQTDDVMALMIAARNSPQCSGHKVGILGSSVGGFLGAYVALYRNEINVTGRPHWNPPGVDYRPDCVVTFSSPFDISDQRSDDPELFAKYIYSLQNYVGTCSLSDARAASPISLIDSGTATAFKPIWMAQAWNDDTNPPRQIDDISIALNAAGVDACNYVVKYVTSGQGGHALALWNQDDPDNPNQTLGQSAIAFFHTYLDEN